jgi:hypothetical protein
MALFDPEKMFRSLVQAMGVSPEQVQQALSLLFSELNTLKAEREAFKAASGEVVAVFIRRLDAQDARLSRIEQLLQVLLPGDGFISDTADDTAQVIVPLRLNGRNTP